MAVIGGNGHHLRHHVFRQAMCQSVAVGVQHFGYTRNLGGGGSGGGRIATGHQDVDVATALQGGGNGVEGSTLDGCVVVFGDDECGHD